MSKALPDAALSGFAAASSYDAHRPTYPAEAVQQLLTALEVAGVKNAKVADLAAGTGKFTELLAARPEEFEILAIEPHEGMRAELERKKLKRVRVIDGTAASMPEVKDGELAAIVASQAFHWFANMDALKEAHRVLQPTGVFGMIWNIEDYNAPQSWGVATGWEKTMRDVIWTFDDNLPRFRHEKWRAVFDEQTKSNPLKLHFADPFFALPLGEASVEFETWLPKEDIWKRYKTLSQIAVLGEKQLEIVKRTFFEAIESKDTPVDDRGRVAVHGQTWFAWTSSIPGEPLKSGG